MAEPLRLPDDFPARVRAARGYMNGISQKDFGAKIGMSEGYVKNLERGGKSIRDIEGFGLVVLMAEVSGLPQGFFLGEGTTTAIEQRLAEIETTQRALLAAMQELARRQPPPSTGRQRQAR